MDVPRGTAALRRCAATFVWQGRVEGTQLPSYVRRRRRLAVLQLRALRSPQVFVLLATSQLQSWLAGLSSFLSKGGLKNSKVYFSVLSDQAFNVQFDVRGFTNHLNTEVIQAQRNVYSPPKKRKDRDEHTSKALRARRLRLQRKALKHT